MSPSYPYEPPRLSQDPALTPVQHQILALLADGFSISNAAEHVGIHRNTIRNWRRSIPAFAKELDFAIAEQALLWQETTTDIAPMATMLLNDMMSNDIYPAATRLRAALAVLKLAGNFHPTVVQTVQIEKDAQSCTIEPPPLVLNAAS